MRIFIAGIDGYLGWSLAVYLAGKGHEIAGADAFCRRDWVEEMGSQSALPICPMPERLMALKENFNEIVIFRVGDLLDYDFVLDFFKRFEPEAIVHLGEMPSAAYSMIDAPHDVYTQTNNVMGTLNILHAMQKTCPGAHLIKLGTMGEYGTPNIDIPEGFFEVIYRGRTATLPFPRQAGSWYHQSKVHDSNNVAFACKMWGLRSTDIMQGVVYGTRIYEMGADPRLYTRFDFDQCFGTVINRYCAQAVIGHPLTVYGSGMQKRGFLSLHDSMQCLSIAIGNPPQKGEYRVFNQFKEVYDLAELARKVKETSEEFGLNTVIEHIGNPRTEMEYHYYNPDHQHLLDLGYKPLYTIETELELMLEDLIKHKERIITKRHVLIPDIRWDGVSE